MNLILANISQSQFEEGVNTVKDIAQSWDIVWKKVLWFWDTTDQTLELSSQVLYKQLCNTGLVIATFLLMFLAIRQFKDLSEGNYLQYFTNLFMPLIVVILLSNNGHKLADLTMGMRHFINEINLAILDSAVDGYHLELAYQDFISETAYSYVGPNLHSQCEVLTGQEQLNCLAAAIRQTMEINPENQTSEPTSSTVLDANPWSVLGTNDGEIDSNGATSQNPSRTLVDPNYYNRPLFNTAGETAIFTTLNAFQSGYQQLLEASLLFAALMGPIAVGGALTPLGASNTLAAWLTGFYGAGLAKLSFNIIVGFAAVAANIAGPSDPLPLASLTALGAPILSAGMAGFSSVAIWQGITSASANIAETGLKLLGRFI